MREQRDADFPSDSLPQIVFPMDEDVIPPNPVCSAPPLSEPPSLLLPLSSITLSSANDGRSGHRRSGRIQEIKARIPKRHNHTESQAAPKPSRQNPSQTKRLMESAIMGQMPQSKLPRVELTNIQEKLNKNEFEFSFTAERQNQQNDPQNPQKMDDSPSENVVEPFDDEMMQNLDEMDRRQELLNVNIIENASASKGWVIGPLFQSLKSKMASFTEIVMSPVKLFRANSPPPSMDHLDQLGDCELQADGRTDVEPSEPDLFPPQGQIENKNHDDITNQQILSDIGETQSARGYSNTLQFEFSPCRSEPAAECAKNQKDNTLPDSVPLLQSPLACAVSGSFESSVLLQSSNQVSASQQSVFKIPSAVEEQRDGLSIYLKSESKQVTRIGSELKNSEDKTQPSNSEIIDEQLSHLNSVKSDNIDSRIMNSNRSSSVSCPQLDTQNHQIDDGNVESCLLVRQSLRNNLNDPANITSLKPSLDAQQTEVQLKSEMCSVSNVVRAKRGLGLNCHSQDSKRKKVTGVQHTENQELINMVQNSEVTMGLIATRRGSELMNTITDEEETTKPGNEQQVVLTRANTKGKSAQEMLVSINEAVIIPSSSDALFVCSGVKTSGKSHDSQMGSTAKPSGSCKKLRTKKALSKPDVNSENSMDLETTVPVTSTEQAEEKPLYKVLVRPDIKQLQQRGKCSNANQKTFKRKLTKHASLEMESTLESTSSVKQLEPITTNIRTSQSVQGVDSVTPGLSQSSKRSKNSLRGDVKVSGLSQSRDAKQCITDLNSVTKENHSQPGKAKVSTDPAGFKIKFFESNSELVQSHSQLNLDCFVQLNKHTPVSDGKEKSTDSMVDKIFLTDSEAKSCSRRSRHADGKKGRTDGLRRRCRVLLRTHKSEEGSKSVTMEDADLASSCSSETDTSRRLLRSYSCPEISSSHPHDSPWTTSLHFPHHSSTHTSHHHNHSASHSHKSQRRTRRHTVCSVEVEREIAPLCLRKEVYPSRRSAPYDPAIQHLSPSHAHSLSPLACRFLSSPLAFLSKKFDCKGAAASPTSRHVLPPSSSSVASPSSSSIWLPPGFISRTESAAVSDSQSSANPLQCEAERRQQSEDEDYASSSSPEFEDVGLREEKALSDSEIKFVKKHEERGKVSSIKIRKTLPKPQTNLTPMGLPKPIRLKKKEFSLEEIYTNKNFSKAPESRLETIFEVPLNRKNGAESWFGPRRVKRFLEFLEVGEVRKPKKPLVGVGKAGISSSRPRRGGFPKNEPSLRVQDVDSLLCAKLDELNLWLMHDQNDS